MKTSASGLAKIEQREGRRLTAYRDTKGVWTIGVGHTGRMMPPKVVPGMTITQAECDAFLAADLGPVEAVINAAVRVPLSQNEFDALASLGFNIGTGGLRTSTVIKRLNVGDVTGAADAILMWNKPSVLLSRRKEEMAQFLTPDAPTAADPAPAKTVASDRAESLKQQAAAAKASVATKAQGGAVTGAVIASTAAAAAVTHHFSGAMILGGLAAIGVAIDGIAAWANSRAANAMATNAVKESAVAAAIPISPVKGTSS